MDQGIVGRSLSAARASNRDRCFLSWRPIESFLPRGDRWFVPARRWAVLPSQIFAAEKAEDLAYHNTQADRWPSVSICIPSSAQSRLRKANKARLLEIAFSCAIPRKLFNGQNVRPNLCDACIPLQTFPERASRRDQATVPLLGRPPCSVLA